MKAVDDSGPNALVNKIEINNSGTSFGKQIDDFISLNKDEFIKKYLVVNHTIVGDLDTLAKLVANSSVDLDDIEAHKNSIIALIINTGLFKTVTRDETRLKKFDTPEFYHYVGLLRKHPGKVFLTPPEYSKLVDARNILFTHKSTREYFNCGDDSEEIYQVQIEFKYKDKNIKTILDKIIINHNEETIQGIDLKSGSVDSTEFMKSFMQYKYYIQGGLYLKALQEWIKNSELAHYKILPFKFVFLPTYNFNNAKTFIFTEKWVNASWKGFTTRSGYKYRGIDELIDLVNWHIEHQVFNETKEFYENKEVELDSSFITVE